MIKLTTIFLVLFQLTCFSQNITSKTLRKKFWVTDIQTQNIDTLFNRDTLKLTRELNYVPFFSSENPQFKFIEKDLFVLVFDQTCKTLEEGIKSCNFKNECGKWKYNSKSRQMIFCRINTDSNTTLTDDDTTWPLKCDYIYRAINQNDSLILLIKEKPPSTGTL